MATDTGSPQSAVGELDGRALGVGLPPVTPLQQGEQHREQLDALGREAVLVAAPLAGLLVRLAGEDALVDEPVAAAP